MRLLTAFSAVFLVTISALAQAPAPSIPTSVTVPITLDHNRVIIDVHLRLPDGSTKRVRAWVDNGNPDMWITAALAEKLKLPLTGEPQPALNGQARSTQPPPVLMIGNMEIKSAGVKAYAELDRESVGPGMSAEISIPSTVLRQCDVVIDYPNRELTIGAPGKVHFQGASTKVNVNTPNALIEIPSRIEGEEKNLGLDIGASFSFIAGDLFSKLRQLHPQWPHMTGGVGPANLWGFPDEPAWQVMRVASLQYGPVTLSDIGVASFRQEYMDWFEKRAGVKSAGLIGANALLNYCIGLDYAHSMVYLDQTAKNRPPEMDVVGLTLRPQPDGNYTVIGIATYDGKPSVPEVMPNDVLVAIDKTLAKGGTMGQVWSLLSGDPGEERELELTRDGKKLTVNATVRRFLGTQEHTKPTQR